MKKQLVVDLDDKPKNFDEFIQCIERYLIKNGHEYEFLVKDKPAIVLIDKKKHECSLIRLPHLMGMSWFLSFTEL